jgi:hypothetical protein
VRNRYLEGFARILPSFLIFTSIVGLLIGGVVLGRWDYSVRGLIVAVPAIIASIVLLYMFKHPIGDDDGVSIVFFSVKTAPYFLFILLYLISVIILLAGVNRLLYFFVIAALYLTIFVQIFSQKISSNAIILEIVSVMTNVIYGTTLVYPLFFRTTDILIHNTLSTVTFLSGHTIPVDLDASYAPFPLFHVYNAVSSNILGLPAQDTHFIVTCLAYVIVVFFMYKIFMILSANEQVSLLACLCFSVTPTVLTRGIEMVTSVTAFVGFVILLYLVFTAKERELLKGTGMDSVIFKSLVILLAIYIILVHQVSVAQIVLLIALLMVCELILAETRYFSTYLMLFITISFSAYWIFSSRLFLDQLIGQRIDLDYFDFGEKHQILIDPSLDQMQAAMMFIQNQMDMGIFLFFALVGIGYILYRQKPEYLPVVAMFSLFVLVLYVPNPLLTSQTISRMFRIDRFGILLAPFMALIMASGIFWLGKFTQKHTKGKRFNMIVTLLFAIFVLLSLQNPILGITDREGRLYFTNGELSGYNYVTEKIPYGSELHSDYHTARYFYFDNFSLTDELELPYYRSNVLSNTRWTPQVDQYIVFRDSKFEDWSVHFTDKTGGGIINYVSDEENKQDVEYLYGDNNIIYSDEQISIIIGRF